MLAGNKVQLRQIATLAPEAMRRPLLPTLDQGAKNRKAAGCILPRQHPFDTATLAVTGQKPPPPGDRGKQAGEKLPCTW